MKLLPLRPHADEGLLRQFLGVAGVEHDAREQALHGLFPRVHEFAQRGLVAALHALHRLAIGAQGVTCTLGAPTCS
ncbi:MAG: hypothetical protein NVV63_07010 [Opitutus sp.]|nr:hypothetical protein [Opitutus sp.]